MSTSSCQKPPRYTATKTYQSEGYPAGNAAGVIDRETLEIACFGIAEDWVVKLVEKWTDGLNSGKDHRNELSWSKLPVRERWYTTHRFLFEGDYRMGIVDRQTQKIAMFGRANADDSTMQRRLANLKSGNESVDDLYWRDLSEGTLESDE